ncbi:NhaP-type Na+/H+ or K+/H+ antiporter [Actinoplanes octamycinicus]|uniref:NhaP-type Na+/H+ or K+/H+ antiporter n=1 Tax=Actinoplanes octamycinicus TaxID=135948 RepID=A0A7W7M7W7_9ACTN|nr:cation:proton antiporter [Actinoplanes octamycinicus]MBB4740312.1 NhaP-type Na+/H+ or K+/H+ antiporter [Actinoplanes octamycinicus]GIE62612.1 sodium:proton antiporter [Actinoplanes octamycinicus]
MDAAAVASVALIVFVWGLFSVRLGRADLSAPIVFVAAGLVLAEGLHVVEVDVPPEAVKLLAEVTLVWVLFADASRVGLRELRADLGVYVRLLGVGLPLTMVAGTLLALGLFGDTGFWLALLVGAALAPTDAALGASVMTNPEVPDRVRRLINVESGLNDGIATPVVMLAIAAEGIHQHGLSAALIELAIGAGAGILVGTVGGRGLRLARRRGWASEDFAGPAVLALTLVAYAGTLWLAGNGFVAAFVAGLAFGHVARRGEEREIYYVEQTAGLMSLLTWLVFGAVAVPIVLRGAGWADLLYAALSLTVVRMLPVALALIGSRLPALTVAFLGWFGPRGLASVIFAVIALEELPGEAGRAVTVIGVTVLLSVLAHGLTGKPLADRYAARIAGVEHPPPERQQSGPLPVRGLLPHRVAEKRP